MEIGSVEHLIEAMKEAVNRYNSNTFSTMVSVVRGNLDFLAMVKEGKNIFYTVEELKQLFDAMYDIVQGEYKED